MGELKLGYSTFGMTNLPMAQAIDEIDRAGYEGVEISFHRDQFNPFVVSDDELRALKKQLAGLRIEASCVATAAHFFDPHRPHDPSLMATERAARKRRIDLVRRGIHVARMLDIPLVTFGSGFLRPEHEARPDLDPMQLLADSIAECLEEIGAGEERTLLLEPEPGMFIETLAEGQELLRRVGSDKFRLHIDICHAYCSEEDYPAALRAAAQDARYLHVSDARVGYNLGVVEDRGEHFILKGGRNLLVHFPDTADFLLLDRERPTHFPAKNPDAARKRRIRELLQGAGIDRPLATVPYDGLYAGPSSFDDEIFTWMISVPRLSFDVLERTRPIVLYLRGVRSLGGNRAEEGPSLVRGMVANTRTGIVHFHEIPGEGTLDFAATFRALDEGGFSGHGSVELYHHVESWEKALHDTRDNLARYHRFAR